MTPSSASSPMPPAHAFLLRVACLLNAYGTPAHRLERELLSVADSLDVRAAFHSTPTGILASFGAGNDERVHLVRVEPGEIDLGRLSDFDEVIEDVRVGRLDVAAGLQRLDGIEAAPARFAFGWVAAGFALASAGAARLLGGDVAEMVVSAILGTLIFVLARVLSRHHSSIGTLEPLAAFLAAFVSMAFQELGVIDAHRVATLGALIVLVPGLTLTLSLVELSTGHLVSGVARFARAMVLFLTIVFGVALAWALGGQVFGADAARGGTVAGGPTTFVLAMALTPAAFALLFQIRKRDWPAVALASWLGFAAGEVGVRGIDYDAGIFLGALVIGLLGNLYARFLGRPALVVQVPAILLLVPGSKGYASLVHLFDAESVDGLQAAFQTGLVAAALAAGLLAANLVLPPRREL